MAKKIEGLAKTSQTIGDRLAADERRSQATELQRAFTKLQAGDPLTSRERTAVRVYESEQLAKWGSKYVAACPKSDYCDSVGIHQKVAIEQSRRFGLPYHTSGKTINLWEQLAGFHKWMVDNKHAIMRVIRAQRQARESGDDDEEGEQFDYWDTRRVKAVALLKEHDYEERLGKMQPIEVVHDLLQQYYVTPMNKRIEQLDKQGGSVATELAGCLRKDIDDFERAINALFVDDENTQSTDSAA